MFSIQQSLESINEINSECENYDFDKLNSSISQLDSIFNDLVKSLKTINTENLGELVEKYKSTFSKVNSLLDQKIKDQNEENLIEETKLKCSNLDLDFVNIVQMVYFEIAVGKNLSFSIGLMINYFIDYINNSILVDKYNIKHIPFKDLNENQYSNIRDWLPTFKNSISAKPLENNKIRDFFELKFNELNSLINK